MGNLLAGVLIPLLIFVPIFVFVLAFGPRRECPDCGRPLPRLQSPFTKTLRQWVEGGYLCPHCGCETDLAGKKVAPGTGPRAGWRVRSALLVFPPAVVAVVLLVYGISLTRQPSPRPLAPEPRAVPDAPRAAPAPAEPGR
jgi:hypothetical protein